MAAILMTATLPPVLSIIKGETVELVDSYKFLGVHLNSSDLNSSLDWSDNALALHSRGKSRLFSLRRLRGFGVCNRMLQMFYRSLVESALFFWNKLLGGKQQSW